MPNTTRPIKFRAWDGKEMIQDYIVLIETPSGGLTVSERMAVSQNVMQFTGLLDKNGKEIYEGDVIEYPALGERSRKVRQVVQWKTYSWAGIHLYRESEVVGNIYEHELLKP